MVLSVMREKEKKMSDAKKCDRCGNFYTLYISDEKDKLPGSLYWISMDDQLKN